MADRKSSSVGFVKELNLADAQLLSFRANHSSAFKTQSVVDGELVEDIVERVVEHTYQNAQLLRYRLLQSVGVTLNPVEEESLVAGEEKNIERRSMFSEELGIVRDAVMMHFYPSKRSQLMAAGGGAANGGGGSGQSSFRGSRGDVGPNAQMLCLKHSSLSDIIKEQIDSMFQLTYQETSLRLTAYQSEVEEKLGPSRRLNRAISLQRERTDNTMKTNHQLELKNMEQAKRITELEASAERREDYHKQQLNAYLREVAILKEQLYRTYRDKTYVGKDVDLMPPIVDDDACEDVNVDQLLHYRRTMRSVDQQIASYQAKIKALEEEVEAREQAMAAFQEKQRSRELAVANAQKELDDMNAMVVKFEQDVEDKDIEIMTLKAELHHLKTNVPATASTGTQATEEEDEARAATYTYLETSEALLESKHNALMMFEKALAEKFSLKQELLAQEKKAREEKKALEDALHAMEQRALYAEKRQDDLRRISQDAIARQEVAESHAAEVTSTATAQATVLAAELNVAQTEVVSLRSQNATLCLAYTNMWERLQAIKTKAGLSDYKKRSNEHHFQRAEAAVQEANRRIEATETRCADELRQAEERAEMVNMNLAFALEDVKCLKRKHQSDMALFERRIQQVENASLALLDDYNRLRTEHLKLTAVDAMKDAQEEELIQQVASRLGSATANKERHVGAGGTAGRGHGGTPQQRRLSVAEEQLQQRQTFAFEILSSHTSELKGAGDAAFPLHVQALLDALAIRRDAAGHEELFDRKVRPQQLPTLAAKEFENALICALYPLLETLLTCTRSDAELLVLSDSANHKHQSGTSPQHGSVKATSVLKDYQALVRGESDAELAAMGLGEQREVAAWGKLKHISNVEGHLRQCLQRMQRAAGRVNIVALDMAPVPVIAGGASIDSVVVSAVDQAKREDELQRVKDMEARMKENQRNAATTSKKKPSSKPLPPPPQSHETPSRTSLAMPHAAGPAAPSAANRGTPTLAPLDEQTSHPCNDTAVHEMIVEIPADDSVASMASRDTSGTSTPLVVPRQRPPRPDAHLQRRDPSQDALYATPDETLLSSHAPGVSRRPSSTGSPSGRRSQGGRWAGLPSKHVVLPSLRADRNATQATLSTESTRVGPSASSDASIVPDETLAGVARIPLRSEASVESDSAFGNALSVNKEYLDLRSRLERSLVAKGLYTPDRNDAAATMPHDPNTTVAAAAPRGGTPTFTTTPPWKVFKEQQRRMKH
jgi:hypothetical protein